MQMSIRKIRPENRTISLQHSSSNGFSTFIVWMRSSERSFIPFVFQAEDGIRDSSVTGVQTCALPICAAMRPVHAYLLVGPRGSGTDEAARCFAAAVIAPDDDRVWDLARRGRHPDIVEIDPA